MCAELGNPTPQHLFYKLCLVLYASGLHCLTIHLAELLQFQRQRTLLEPVSAFAFS